MEDINMATVLDRVKSIVAEKLGVDESEITSSSSFTEDLNADSLDLVELIMAFEEEFSSSDVSVEISDEDAEGILNIQNAIDYLKTAGVEEE